MSIGSVIIRKKYITSSLEWAREVISSATDGTILLTDFIEHARGRQGRKW